MKFESSQEESFELRIVGYEFPEIENDKYDSNWLIIEIEVRHQGGHWVARDPSLLTFEVEKLVNWLLEVSYGEETITERDFIEPNLTFRIVETESKGKVLRVYFECESRPKWQPETKGLSEDLWVEFPLGELNLQESAESLRQQLSNYPKRAIR